jgi:hypothetical protein
LIPGSQPELKSGSIQTTNHGTITLPLEDQFSQLKVYPNPTEDQIRIDGLPANEKVEIKIYNSGGQLVQQLQNNSGFMTIDFKSQPAGIYYIHLNGHRLDPIIKK